MKIMRHLRYATLAIVASLACAFDYSVVKPITFVARQFEHAFDLPAVGMQRLKLILAKWRTGSSTDAGIPASSLMASSNHFVMPGTFRDFGEVGWRA
jgi:hypothetical protein